AVGRMNLPDRRRRGYPDARIVGSLGGPATLGLLIPPSIILIVCGVAAEASIARLFIAGVGPGLILALLFSGWIAGWALLHPRQVPDAAEGHLPLKEKLRESRQLIPVLLLVLGVIASIYTGVATATESAAIGVLGAFLLSAWQNSLPWQAFRDSLLGATRLHCMIALILPGAPFMTPSMR